jgi:surface antigen
MRPLLSWLLPLLCLALAACSSGQITGARAGDYVGGPAAVECAPFARALTGVSLSGDGADWWRQAEGRYARSRTPEVGSVLVFRRSGRLPYGHVAVVSAVLSRRQIMVTQANWVHRRVTEDQPVLDVSSDGDWSAVRVWWPPSGQIGTSDYEIFGFIRPDHPFGHYQLIAATPRAIRIAEGVR